MATVEEVLAKAAEWEAAGHPDKAAKLRAYAETIKPSPKYDAEAVEAKAAEWEKAGDKEKAAKLRAYAATLPKAETAKPARPDTGPATPARADMGDTAEGMRERAFARFEEANPALKGRYTPDNFPKAGEVVVGPGGGGGKSGAPRYTVRGYQEAKDAASDTFGDTAAAVMEGPVAGMQAFAGGLTGGESPSRQYLANDPLTRNLPGPVLTGLGGVGDLGGAALSALAAGITGVTGLAAELVPGQSGASERRLAEDLTGMSMFAVPELAGVSSIPARVAAAAPKAAPVPNVPRLAGDVAAAERAGIPVMRTDVRPPTTFIGNVAQKTGESIPIAGTGGVRAAQNEARIEAARRFARLYGADTAAPAIDDVAASLLEKRSADLGRYTRQKREVIDDLAGKGVVPVPKAVAAIDDQIAKLRKQRMAGLEPVIAKLEDFKASIRDQNLTEIEANRAVIGEAFSGLDMGAIRTAGEKALSAVYGPLREDMAAFIKSVGGSAALNKWATANAKLSDMAGELGNTALKRALSKGEASPETVRSMLFSAKPSDVKLLARNLDERGKASARAAIIQEALSKAGGIDELSPDKFKQALGKLGNQVGVFFKGEDFAAADGLLRALKLTERAGVAGAAPLTGVQNVPAVVGILVSSFFGGSIPATAAALGGIGGIARVYEAAGVKSALRALSRAETPKAQGQAVQTLARALEDAGVPTGQAAATEAANSNRRPEYEALWGRY